MNIKKRDIPAHLLAGAKLGPKKPKPPRIDVFRSKWERDYNTYLTGLYRVGEIQWFEHEPMRLRIGIKPCWYTVDFLVMTKDGRLEGHEVKGHWREAAKVRIRAAADRYPFIRFVVVRPNLGGWRCEGVGIIPPPGVKLSSEDARRTVNEQFGGALQRLGKDGTP